MMDATKYAPGYYPVPAGYDSWVKKDHIEKAPSVSITAAVSPAQSTCITSPGLWFRCMVAFTFVR